jgi:hypothetical protein
MRMAFAGRHDKEKRCRHMSLEEEKEGGEGGREWRTIVLAKPAEIGFFSKD